MTKGPSRIPQPLVFGACLAGVLAILFFQSFNPSQVLFSNDGPLGAVNAAAGAQPSGFKGLWFDLNSVGINGGSFYVSITSALLWLLGPLFFAKFYVPLVLAIVGTSAWLCFRQLKLTPLACLLGALAATLNSAFFSAACWGVGSQVVLIGMSYLAVGLLVSSESSRPWIKVALAGFAVGMGVMEGFDLGAIFSLLLACFVLFQAATAAGSTAQRIKMGLGRLLVVAGCAGLLACHAVTGLVSTQIQGVAGAEQDTRSKAERWDWATQWSMPKREALALFIPGIFGYRMETPAGGNYWGAAGRDPAWDRYFAGEQQGPPPGGFMRYSGGGNYAGVLVILVALWCALQSFRKDSTLFTSSQRKNVWFWSAVVIVSLLLAFGRHAPFYQFLYALPYFSTIRNPAKFLHILSFAVVILFAYGLDGLSRRYLEPSPPGGANYIPRFQVWWSKAARSDKRWIRGSFLAIGASVLGWLIYGSSRASLEHYLQTVQFDEATSKAIAGFSLGQAGWFILFLTLAVVLIAAILSGRFMGQKATWGAILLGLLLVVDMGRANLPWILYWDYQKKYATNPVIEFLREKPYEHRVAIVPFQPPRQFSLLSDLYRIEWAQHHFQYYNIQSLDIVQMPRTPADLLAFETALRADSSNTVYRISRRWELTNTRYLLGAAGFVDVLNQQIDPEQKRFRPLLRFDLVPKAGLENPKTYEDLTAVTNSNGQFAIIEFTGTLPRASLYSHWQVSTNASASLNLLASPAFDPARTVLVANPLPVGDLAATNIPPGTVEFAAYAPKDIRLRAKAAGASLLLLNDRYDPNWHVTVDGKPAALLRCNYLMRGVQVPAGEHEVRFVFAPPLTGLYVSLAAIVVGIGLIGIVAFSRPREELAQAQASH